MLTGWKMTKITVPDKEVVVSFLHNDDEICITDIARYKDSDRTDDFIRN